MGKDPPPIIDAAFEVVSGPTVQWQQPQRRRGMLLRQKIGWSGIGIGVLIAAIDIATDGRAFTSVDALFR
jgi:hypothetical protein